MNKEVKEGIIITISVIIVLVIVYLTTAIFLTGEIGSNKNDNKDNEITTDESASVTTLYDDMIIASKTFNMPQTEYMVVFFSEKEASENVKTTISSYDSADKGIKLYKVNTDEAINKFVIAEESNNLAANENELKINDITVITINNKNIVSYEVGEEAVINKIK